MLVCLWGVLCWKWGQGVMLVCGVFGVGNGARALVLWVRHAWHALAACNACGGQETGWQLLLCDCSLLPAVERRHPDMPAGF